MKKIKFIENLGIFVLFIIPFSFLVMIPMDLLKIGNNLNSDEMIPIQAALVVIACLISFLFVKFFWKKFPKFVKYTLAVLAASLTFFALQ